MNLARSKLALVLVLCSMMLGQICQAAGAKSKQVFELDQWHPNWGPMKIYVGHDRVLIVPLQFHYEVIGKGPDWQIFAFNKVDKTICNVAFDRWKKNGATVTVGGATGKVPSDYRQQNLELLGHRCIRYRGSNDSFDYVRDLGCDSHAYGVVNGFYQIYAGDGMIVASERDRPRDCRIKTNSIKQVQLPDSAFDYPKDYRKVTSPQLVMLTNAKKEEFEDIVEQLGVGKSFSQKHH